MNPPPKKPFIRIILSQDYFIPGLFYPGYFPQDYYIPGLIYPLDPNPKYTEDMTILNTAPKLGDLWCSQEGRLVEETTRLWLSLIHI